MFLRTKILLVVWLQLVCLHSYSQLVNAQHYTTADGLGDNRITVIRKDRDGFMWFGSWAGISRFDGYRFTTFKSYPGDNSPLKSNRIDEIVEDAAGLHLWLGAYDKIVYRFDKRTGTFLSLAQLLGKPSFEKETFTKILAVKDHRVWLKTESMGLILVTNSASDRPQFARFSTQSKGTSRLSSNDIHHFHLDVNRNIWLTLEKGMDILTFGKDQSYSAKKLPSLDGLIVTGLVEAKNMAIVATANGILFKFDHTFNVLSSTKISPHGINAIIESRKSGNTYCTTTAGELIEVDGRNKARVIFKTNDGTQLGHIYEDASGVLWLGSQRVGVIRFNPQNQETINLYPPKNYKIVPGMKSFTAFEDQNATVYLNFDGQVTYYNSQKKKMELLSSKLINYPRSKNVVRAFYDKSGVLWLGSGYEGIDKMVFQENPFTHTRLRPTSTEREANEVRGLFTDRQNRLWVGTKKGEVFVYPDGKGQPQYFQEGFNNDAGVYAIYGDQRGSLWLGTKGNGLYQGASDWRNGENTSLSNDQPNPNNPNGINSHWIYCLLEDQTGRIWAGSYDHGLILAETFQGKTTFKTIRNSFSHYPTVGFRKIRHLAQDKNGLIWIATTDGLLIFDPNTGTPQNYKFKSYTKEPGNIKSLGGNDIQYIYPDSKGRVWVLTTTGGLNLAVGKQPMQSLSFINYSTKNGLPSDFLLSCAEDSAGNLWIATQNGLSKQSNGKFQNFGPSDGLGDLSFSEASATKMKNGELVFGTTIGLVSFNPQTMSIPKITAPLVLTNLQINSEDISPGTESPLKHLINHTEKIELEHDQNIVSFDFAVLDFHATDKQNFATRLVGYDDVWRSTQGQRRVTYTKLPPGKYTLEVKSLNDELYKRIPFKSLEILIHPPLWRTWWAYLIYIITGLVAIVLIRRNALTMFKLKQRVQVEQQVAELKIDFFNQISHELRTPLTMIISPSEEIKEHEQLSERGNEYISIVLANAKRMLHLVNQVLNLRKVKSGKDSITCTPVPVIPIIEQLIFSFKETLDRRNLVVTIIPTTNEIVGWLDKSKFEIIVYNLLGNAIKFSEDGGQIDVYVEKKNAEGIFTLTVVDQGSGVNDDELQSIFNLYFEGGQKPPNGVKGTGIGLALSKELVQLHGGQIAAGHHLPHGLEVKVTLPLHQAHAKDGVMEQAPEDTSIDVPGRDLEDEKTSLPILLIVEDHDDLRNFLKGKFKDAYHVETAADGEEGLSKAKTLLPNLILSDIMMPKKDGIELLDALKNDPSTSHIPVVLLSAKFSIESQIEGLKYGADYYLPKPFNWTLLKTAVDNILKQRSLAFNRLQNKEEVTPEEAGITAYDKNFLDKLLNIVEERLNDAEFNIDDVADSLGMSRSAFYRKFKSLTATAPIDFVRDTRLRKAKELLDAGEDNVSVVAYSVGFNSPKYFTLCFKNKYKQTPSDYLKSLRKK